MVDDATLSSAPTPALANVVITAAQFNPSVFSQTWMEKIGLANVEELLPDSLFSAAVTIISTPRILLQVVPTNLQFFARGDDAVSQSFVSSVVERIVRTLPHVPYTAIGLNFTFNLRPVDDLGSVTRDRFASRATSQHLFDAPNARFGAYASCDVGFARARLNMLPTTLDSGDGEELEFIQISANFNRKLAADSEACLVAISEVLGNWDEALMLTTKFLQSIE